MNVWQKKIVELEETIARIRAETAKNSGEVVAWMHTLHMEGGQERVLFSSFEEKHPFGRAGIDYSPTYTVTSVALVPATALATPANSRAEAIAVKALEWTPAALGHSASHGLTVSISSTPIGEYCVVKGQLGFFVTWYCQKDLAGVHETKEAAKQAAQADYEQRIRSALLQQEGE